MKNGNGGIKSVRLVPMVLVFVMILSGLGMVSSAGEESVEITTDQYTYCIGDPVTITAIGFIPHDLWDDYFAITDEQGNLVVEPFPIIILFPGGSNKTITWTWNQTRRHYGYYTELVLPSGEQVPTGKYYAWLGHNIPGSAYGPAEFEIVDCNPEPRALKQDAIEQLEGAKTGDSKIDKKIDKAIKHIEKSLNDKYWLDESHLDPKYGKKVFYYEKKAVKYLQKLIKDKKTPDSVKDVCREVIDELVEADNLLAHIAYEEAQAYSGHKKVDKELAKCEKEFEKAEEEIAKGHPDKAIDHYKKAWEHAQKAIKHGNKR